jgi:anti-anti-sigma factor
VIDELNSTMASAAIMTTGTSCRDNQHQGSALIATGAGAVLQSRMKMSPEWLAGGLVTPLASINRSGNVSTVVVSGDVDLATGPAIDQSIRESVSEEGVGAVLVDLAGVGFLDSSGIALLLKGRRLAAESGVAYRVIGANSMTRRVLELCGVWEHLCGASTELGRP